MSNEVGRTGFHLKHTKAVSERGAILDEMMRELSDESIARWASRNPNIVVEDERLNIALVNGGEGDMVPCEDPKEVLAYGQQRLARLSSPVREGKVDPVTGKVKGGTTTTSMFVLHLPKSMCREVPDFYPVLDEDGDVVGRRSRWVARDRDEALRYFDDAMEFMASEVIPGGWDAVLGADIQFSESTPHIQVLADTFAPDPRPGCEGQLRCDFSRAYGSHRDVRDFKGRQMSGQAKFRKYHADLKNWMIERGWPVEREVDPLRHDKTATKEIYGRMMDSERVFRQKARAFEDDVRRRRAELNQVREEIATKEQRVSLARKQVEQDRVSAREEGRKEGYDQGRAEGIAEAERLRQQAREQLARARSMASEAEQHLASVKTSRPLSGEQARAFFRDGAVVQDPAVQSLIEDRRQKYLRYSESDKFIAYAESLADVGLPRRQSTLDRQQRMQRKVSDHLREAEEFLAAQNLKSRFESRSPRQRRNPEPQSLRFRAFCRAGGI